MVESNKIIFKPIPVSVPTKIVGYVAYTKYNIPLLILCKCDENDENFEIALEFCSYQDINTSLASIMIGWYLWENLDKKDILNIIYHEIVHILSGPFFNEKLADEFAVAHIGHNTYIKSLENLNECKFKYFEDKDIDENIKYTYAYTEPFRYELAETYKKRINFKAKIKLFETD